MAKQLDEFPEGVRIGRPNKYNWDEWLDGRIWLLEGGVDFQSKAEALRSSAKSAAKKRGGSVRAAVTNGGKDLIIQFFVAS